MPLYDVTFTNPRLVNPIDAENYDVIQAVKRKRQANTWSRMVQTVDEAIDWAEQTGAHRLIWTRSAALFGHGSLQPKARVDHLWDNVIAAVGGDVTCLKAVGGLLRWRISLRTDTWLVYRKDTDEKDPTTGKLITVSEYWINNNFSPPQKKKSSGLDLSGLSQAWVAN